VREREDKNDKAKKIGFDLTRQNAKKNTILAKNNLFDIPTFFPTSLQSVRMERNLSTIGQILFSVNFLFTSLSDQILPKMVRCGQNGTLA
jgi:hypothetical protein